MGMGARNNGHVHERVGPAWAIYAAVARDVKDVPVDLVCHTNGRQLLTTTYGGRITGMGVLSPPAARSLHKQQRTLPCTPPKNLSREKREPTHRKVNRPPLNAPIKLRQQALREQPLLRRPQPSHARPNFKPPAPLARDELPRKEHADDHAREKLEQAEQADLALRGRVRLCARWVRVPARDRG